MNVDATPEDIAGQAVVEAPVDTQGTALVAVESVVPTVETLIAKAVEHGISVEGLEKLLSMHERMEASAAKKAFFEALSAFQSDCPVIAKDKTATVTTQGGSSYQYSYAPLESIVQAISPSLRTHGLSVRFDARFDSDAQVVTCIVNHRDGHSERSEFRAPLNPMARAMNPTQQAASALTYGRRYALLNALGIVVGGEDDDATGGGGPSRRMAGPASRPAPVPSSSTSSGGQAGGETPRPLGRKVVRIPRPSQGPQDSDTPSSGTPVDIRADSAAETPAAPESDANDTAMAELRKGLIESQMRLLRGMKRYENTPDDELWDKAGDVLVQTCIIHYNKPLHEMTRWDLERMTVKMAEVIEQKLGATA